MDAGTIYLKRWLPFYYQNRAHGTCGPLSICMVVNCFRKPWEPKVDFTQYEYLIRKLMNSDILGGVPNHKIPLGLNYFNMDYELLEGDLEEKLDKIREAIRDDYPVILSVHDTFGGRRRGHYVVVIGYDDEHLFLNDPYQHDDERYRHKKISLAEFCKQSSRKSMVWGKKQWAIKIKGRIPG
jgi:hypothetical protein